MKKFWNKEQPPLGSPMGPLGNALRQQMHADQQRASSFGSQLSRQNLQGVLSQGSISQEIQRGAAETRRQILESEMLRSTATAKVVVPPGREGEEYFRRIEAALRTLGYHDWFVKERVARFPDDEWECSYCGEANHPETHFCTECEEYWQEEFCLS